MVKNLECYFTSETKCTLQWINSEGYNCTIKRETNLQWEDIGYVESSDQYVADNLLLGEVYIFSVIASNNVGESKDNVISYMHR